MVSGELVFAGTRVPVKNLIYYLSAEDPLGTFLEDFPTTVARAQAYGYLQMTLEAADLARTAG